MESDPRPTPGLFMLPLLPMLAWGRSGTVISRCTPVSSRCPMSMIEYFASPALNPGAATCEPEGLCDWGSLLSEYPIRGGANLRVPRTC